MDGLLIPDHPDADPETHAAHACGHNAQCAALYGVAAVLKAPGVLDGLCGSIRLCIVPAEEMIETEFRLSLVQKGVIRMLDGKQEYLARGYFDDCDLAFMIHTGGGLHKFSIKPGCNGAMVKTCVFTGKAAHAAIQRRGINALQAANLALSAVNAIRDTFAPYAFASVNPILTEAGTITNAVPDRVVMHNRLRAGNLDDCFALNRKMNRATAAAAAAIGAQVRLTDRVGFLPGAYNKNLADVMVQCMAEVVGSQNAVYLEHPWDTGCSDMGDISHVMPAVHAFGSGAAGMGHSAEYHIADFDSACMDSAKAQVLIIRRLLENDAQAAWQVVRQAKPRFANGRAYADYVDSLQMDKDAVIYQEDGTVLLDV